MKKVKYLGSFIISFCLGVFVMTNFADMDIANNISEHKNDKKEYYQDELGNYWSSKEEYLKYQEDNYFVAPDGSIWKNEYRYQESLK